jgi:hypothetical protein
MVIQITVPIKSTGNRESFAIDSQKGRDVWKDVFSGQAHAKLNMPNINEGGQRKISGSGACGLPWYRGIKVPPATSNVSTQLITKEREKVNQNPILSSSLFIASSEHGLGYLPGNLGGGLRYGSPLRTQLTTFALLCLQAGDSQPGIHE